MRPFYSPTHSSIEFYFKTLKFMAIVILLSVKLTQKRMFRPHFTRFLFAYFNACKTAQRSAAGVKKILM